MLLVSSQPVRSIQHRVAEYLRAVQQRAQTALHRPRHSRHCQFRQGLDSHQGCCTATCTGLAYPHLPRPAMQTTGSSRPAAGDTSSFTATTGVVNAMPPSHKVKGTPLRTDSLSSGVGTDSSGSLPQAAAPPGTSRDSSHVHRIPSPAVHQHNLRSGSQGRCGSGSPMQSATTTAQPSPYPASVTAASGGAGRVAPPSPAPA